ncbi:MAG: hypothetical protein V4613_00465 [Bacteroidota bacterium]
MNQSILKNLVLALVPVLILSFSACKAKTDDPVTPAKTLNKTTLTPKTWYNKGGSIVHTFKAGGVYGGDGTWKWVNNSDTMEIVMIKDDEPTYWKVYWNTDHEMSCEKAETGGAILYKDAAW